MKSALNKYLPDAEKKTDEEISEALQKDPKGYTMQEQQEIFQNIRQIKPYVEPVIENSDNDDEEEERNVDENLSKQNYVPVSQDPTKRTSLRKFYKYRVEPVVKDVRILDAKSGKYQRTSVLDGYKRKGDCLQETYITQRHADRLNAQTPNSDHYFFDEEELKLPMISAEKFDS